MKYVCDICGYVYDPAVGDPDNGVAPGTPWEPSPKIGSARCAASARTSSAPKHNAKREEEAGHSASSFLPCALGYISSGN